VSAVDDGTAGMPATKAGRCVVFFHEGYVGVSPTVINLSKAMARAGYEVIVYSTPTWAPDAGALGPDVRIVSLAPGPLADRLTAIRLGRLGQRLSRLSASTIAYALRGLVRELRARLGSSARTVYLGVDTAGAVAALLSAGLLRRSFIFVSLELRMTESQRTGPRAYLIRLAYRRAACVAIQARDRLQVLNRELGWQHPTVFILPNSPYADASTTGAAGAGENYFRKQLGVGASKRIALQAGMINDITCARELAKGFGRASDWALVLHERQRRSPEEPYLARLRESNRTNLYLSLDPVPYDQVDRVFAAADIGLAFYQPEGPDDENFRLISSSGKLPHYLKFGKPVLVSNLPALAEVVQEFECGAVVNDPSDPDEIGAALEGILSRYEKLSRNALRCFAERYEFGKSAAPLTRFMDSL
jgi:glycosyltransferase involved in cell wall biosynthesis